LASELKIKEGKKSAKKKEVKERESGIVLQCSYCDDYQLRCHSFAAQFLECTLHTIEQVFIFHQMSTKSDCKTCQKPVGHILF